MALLTEDIVLDNVSGWVALVLTGASIHISNITGGQIQCRFGISSTSQGFTLDVGDTMSCEETIFVKSNASLSSSARFTVTK